MVSATELRKQQQLLRARGVRIPLQLQQVALRRGVSPQQILIEREQKRVQAEITQSLKEQALIAEDVLKRAGSVKQLEDLLQTVPQELRPFIKITTKQLKDKISATISQVQDRIKRQQRLIENLRATRKRAQIEGNQKKATTLSSEISGVQEEVNFLQGTIPQLERGSFIPFTSIKESASDLRFGEEERRIALERQFSELARVLPGGRAELSTIFRERRITIEQQRLLGIIKEAKVPDTLPAFRDPKTGEVILMSFLPKIVEEKGLEKIRVSATTLLPTKEFEKPTFDIFGFKTEPTEFEKALGLDLSRLAVKLAPKEKRIIEKVKEIAPKIFDVPIVGFEPGLKGLVKIGVKIEEFERVKEEETKEKRFLENRKFIVDIVTGGSRFETREEFDKRISEEKAGRFSFGGFGFKVLEKIEKKIPRKIPLFVIPGAEVDITKVLEAPVPFVSRQEAIELLDLIIKFGIFSKFFVTGAAAKQKAAKQKAKTKQVKKADKKTINKLIDAAEEEFKKGTLKNKLASISDDIVRDTNPVTKSIKIENMNSLLDEALKRGLIKNFVLDKNTGALAFLDNQGVLTRSVTKLAPELELQIEAILFEAPQISTEALISTGAISGFAEGKIPPFKDLGKIKDLELGKIEGLGELGKIKFLDLGDFNKLKKEQQKGFDKLFEGILTTTKLSQKERQRLKQEEKARQKELLTLGMPQLEMPKLAQPTAQVPRLAQPTIQIPKLAQPTIQIPKLKFPEITFPTPGIPKPPKKPKIIPFFLIPDEKERRRREKELLEGFDVFVKSKGRNKKVDFNVTSDASLDIGSFLSDNTISQQFSRKPTGKKARKSKLQVPENYWELNQRKFNDFITRKGKKVQTPNIYHEKRAHAIDTIGEIQQLSVAKLLAQQRKQNKEMDRMAKNLISGFNNSFRNQKQKKQKFKQFDITKTINF